MCRGPACFISVAGLPKGNYKKEETCIRLYTEPSAPETFDGILGQSHIVKILKNQITQGDDGACLSFLRNKRDRENVNGKDPGKGE